MNINQDQNIGTTNMSYIIQMSFISIARIGLYLIDDLVEQLSAELTFILELRNECSNFFWGLLAD